MQPASPSQRGIRSYVLRTGRMTSAQKRALATGLERWGVAYRDGLLDLPELFGNDAPVTLEIGFGMGHSLLQLATARPGRNFLGIEVHRPGVGALLHGIEGAGLQNVRVICHDAVEVLEHMLPEAALAEVLIFFPDPWHKKRHHKRRLLQPAFAALLTSRLTPGGRLHLATDWVPYAEHMLEVLDAERGLRNVAGPGCYAPRPPERPLTRFEKRGERLGHEVRDLLYERIP